MCQRAKIAEAQKRRAFQQVGVQDLHTSATLRSGAVSWAREKEDNDKSGQVVVLWHSCVRSCAVLNRAPNAQGHAKPLASGKTYQLWASAYSHLVLVETGDFQKS